MPQEPSTPKSGSKSAASAQFSTPFSQTSTKSHESTPRSQAVLQGAIKTELGDATFESASLLDMVCDSKSGVVTSVITGLRDIYDIHDQQLRYIKDGELISWPARDDGERQHYPPLAWLMNTVLDLARKDDPGPKYHSKLRFHVYDRELCQGDGVDPSTKPDLVGIHRTEKLATGEKVSWNDVHIPVEVKKTWPDMIWQVSTYARCCLIFQENKEFVPIILYHHVNRQFRLGFYTRSGLVATHAMDLSNTEGFKNFVRAIVGIHSWPTPAAGGIDPSRTNKYFYLPNNRLYSVHTELCNRKCIRGRATRVYRLVLVEIGSGTQGETSRVSASIDGYALQSFHHQRPPVSHKPARDPSAYQTKLSSKAGPRRGEIKSSNPKAGAHVEEVSSVPPARDLRERESQVVQPASLPSLTRAMETLQVADASPPTPAILSAGDQIDHVMSRRTYAWDTKIIRHLPHEAAPECSPEYWLVDDQFRANDFESVHEVVIKDSWVLPSNASEAEMFQNLGGAFGVPNCLYSYTVQNTRMRGGRTDNIMPEDATYWPLFKNAWRESTPELRIHKRIIFETLGTPLQYAESPRQLVEAIIHAMLGHFNLLNAGWLHRDVSVGNVMIMKKEERMPVTEFECTKGMVNCVGFISDGDQAVLWQKAREERAIRRSGTLPFISLRLIDAWDGSVPVEHTVLDDLESFVWVLLWSILTILKGRCQLDERGAHFLDVMHTDTVIEQGRRAQIARRFRAPPSDVVTKITPFQGLLRKWFTICEDGYNLLESKGGSDLPWDKNVGFYRDLIQSGLHELKTLPETW